MISSHHDVIGQSISIHAPHEGERRLPQPPKPLPIIAISIHAPHEGERLISSPRNSRAADFNPRSPRGGATNGAYDAIARDKFQSTLPTRGSDK